MTVREIDEMVKEMKRAEGAEGAVMEPGKDPVFTLSMMVPRAIAARFDYAYERFCRMEEGDRPLTEFIEALCAEFVAYNPAVIAGRDGYRCQVPGCSCRRNLQVHHIVFRSRGGSDNESNLITLCSSHHLPGVHEGRLIIEGMAPDGIVVRIAAETRAA
jgi:hypothetical protein